MCGALCDFLLSFLIYCTISTDGSRLAMRDAHSSLDLMFVVNVGSEGKEHFHRPLRIGPNLSRLRRIPMAPPLFNSELRSFLAIVIQVLFSSWCWGSKSEHVLDNGVSPCLSICLLSLASSYASRARRTQ